MYLAIFFIMVHYVPWFIFKALDVLSSFILPVRPIRYTR